MNKRAFTILEISIVTLIITFFLVIITTGKTLISQANLRSVIVDLAEINKAISSFRLQFNSWPGDTANSAFATGGNNNNIIESSTTACNSPESIIAWNHLYNSNNYSTNLLGTSVSTAPCISIGSNVPKSKINRGFYFLWNAAGNSGSMFGLPDGNIIHFGSISPNDNSVNGSVLSPNDGVALDSKIDDGIANTGILYGIDGNEFSSGSCSGQWNSSGADYNYKSTLVACRFTYLLEN